MVQCQAQGPAPWCLVFVTWGAHCPWEKNLRIKAVLRVNGGTSCLLGTCDFCTDNSLRICMSIFLFQSKETREILHFHYTTWPDFGVPESPASFLNFLFKVRESGSLSREHGPVVVHCSAGIGRSGTFCLVDTCLLLVRRPLKNPGKEGTICKLSSGLATASL